MTYERDRGRDGSCQPMDRPRGTLGVLRANVLLLVTVGWVTIGWAERLPGAEPASADAVGSFSIPAYAFDRGNAKTYTTQWADGEPMVAFGGHSPVVIEYDIDFPVAAEYVLHIQYAAEAARPVTLLLDGKNLGPCCRTANGTWNTSGAKWEKTRTLTIAKGKHTLQLRRKGVFPHVVRLRFDLPVPLPQSWKIERPKARTLNSPPPTPTLVTHQPDRVDVGAVRAAIVDLVDTFGSAYPGGADYLARLAVLERKRGQIEDDANDDAVGNERALVALRREALLANPLLDFQKLLLVQRGVNSPVLGLPRNWQSNSSLPKTGYDDQIVQLSPVRPDGKLMSVYRPPAGRFVGDVDLHFDADRMLFSMPGDNGRWQVFEIGMDGSALRQLTGEEPDVDSYDAAYLPGGRIVFTSTACFTGVPCVYGSSHVANLYLMETDGSSIRQLCFDQEHDWCPTVLNDGRVLYTRWEYTDTPHSNTRLLFHMNPDGTEQTEYYGSNSYWPNSFFYARPVPGHSTKVVAVIGGHHDHPRMGELVIFDPALGRREADGAVQRIPGRNLRVEPIVRDGLTLDSWPKFLHPYPLSEKHFLVSCKPTSESRWGVYLVDTFDNMVLVKELPGYALFEPVPILKRSAPPIIADQVNLASTDSMVYLSDIYAGAGLRGIPRGTVKGLRIFTYHFAYQNMGGLLGVIGMDGPWDIKRVIGTVPVYADGSAKFKIPANTPISLQPLDGEGKALQLMRSWMTAMPGEVVSCAGCHESPNAAPASLETVAQSMPAARIEPWYGPTRGFSYAREVQPVIDRHCISCHDGQPQPDGSEIPDLRGDVKITDWRSVTPGNGGAHAGKFSVGYAELHRYVRRPGIESDYHMLEPMEFHADTTQLVQMLQKGHYNVELDVEAWDRLITWIDLNCPYHGTWGEELDQPGRQRQRRRELLKRYGNVDDDPEAVPVASTVPVEPVMPVPVPAPEPVVVDSPGWPFDAEEARRRQVAAGPEIERTIDLGNGVPLQLVRIPAGEFVMGAGPNGAESARQVRIDRPFWIGRCEVTNQQFMQFDPEHDSRVESKNAYQFGIHGYPANEPAQPVVRVSWNEAMAFCRWLSERAGRNFSLPTESQWEYACRVGTETPLSYGDVDADFSAHANMADATLTQFASDPYTVDTPLENPPKYDDWIPKDARFDDGALLSVAPGRYQPNAWGLFDMHGNVSEWTLTEYTGHRGDSAKADQGERQAVARPHRGGEGEPLVDPGHDGRKTVRGGSWRDRPQRCTSSFRIGYQPYQRVYNVGFRIVCEVADERVAAAR